MTAANTDATEDHLPYNQQTLAMFVGIIGVAMPLLLWAAHALVGDNECGYDSISHYYYGLVTGDLFVGSLFIIAALVIFYRGKSSAEWLLTVPAGICALGVAIFPTDGAGCELETASGRYFAAFKVEPGADINDPNTVYDVVRSGAGPQDIFAPFDAIATPFGEITVHYAAAGLLFALLAAYCVFIFARVDRSKGSGHIDPETGQITPEKRTRNIVYYIAAGLIIFSMAAIVTKLGSDRPTWNANNGTYWFEALGLFAFGASWLMRARAYRRINRLMRA